MQNDNDFFAPGMLVRHPGQPDWGVGQVQSAIDGRITVMFEHAGKVVLVGKQNVLELVFDVELQR